MKLDDAHIDSIIAMSHSHVHNYVIPGLTSSLIGTPNHKGSVRLFSVRGIIKNR